MKWDEWGMLVSAAFGIWLQGRDRGWAGAGGWAREVDIGGIRNTTSSWKTDGRYLIVFKIFVVVDIQKLHTTLSLL